MYHKISHKFVLKKSFNIITFLRMRFEPQTMYGIMVLKKKNIYIMPLSLRALALNESQR